MNNQHQKKLNPKELDAKKNMVIQKYQELQSQLLHSANKDYQRMKSDPTIKGPVWNERIFNEKLQQICYNVAWMIFAQVNQENNTEHIIDLTCQETQDAQAITKQKIYDLGKSMRMKPQAYGEDQVLTILFQDDHVVALEDEHERHKPDGELQLENAILFTVRDELNLDHFFIPEHNTLLVRINHSTLDNEVLRDGGV